MIGSFPDSFHRMVGPHLQTSVQSACIPQHSSVQYVFFGADNAVLIQFDNGLITWEGLPESLVTVIYAKTGKGWTLGKNTTLCQWDKGYFFVEWTRYYGTETSHSWRIQPSGILTDILIREVVEGQVPVSHTVYKPTPPPPIRTPPQTGGNRAIALYDYSRQDEDEIDLKKDEYLTNVEFLDTDWWLGQNQQGIIGKFPSAYVKLVSDDANRSGKATTAPQQPEIQAPSAISPAYVRCDGCNFKVVTGSYYHCGICNGDNFDLCQACFDAGAWCCQNHPVIKRSFLSNYPDQLPDMSSLRISPNPSPQHQPPNSPYLHPGASSTPRSPSPSRSPASQPDKEKDEYDQKLRDALEGTVVSESPNVHWDDIAGLDQAKDELQETTILPIKFPQLFTGNRKARRAILLYGPPGTGKSFLAKAVATEVNCPLFSISSSDIGSKWRGESER
jgi:hypothetical protein